jgi:hypothetical protein
MANYETETRLAEELLRHKGNALPNLSIQVIRCLEHASIYTLYLDHLRQDIATAEEKKHLLEFGPSLYQESENAALVRKIGIRSCGVGPCGIHVEQCIALALTLRNLVAFQQDKIESDVSPPSAGSSIFDRASRIRPSSARGSGSRGSTRR